MDIDPALQIEAHCPSDDTAQGDEDEVSEGTERENGSHEQAHEEGQVRCLHENSSDSGVDVGYFRSVEVEVAASSSGRWTSVTSMLTSTTSRPVVPSICSMMLLRMSLQTLRME